MDNSNNVVNVEEKHPVKALVYGILSIVLSLVALGLMLGVLILGIVYLAMKQSGQVKAEDLATVALVYRIITIVFGVCSAGLGIAGLTFAIVGNPLAKALPEDGRAKAGLITTKIGFPLSIVAIALSVILGVTFAVLLSV